MGASRIVPEIQGLRGIAVLAIILGHVLGGPLAAMHIRWFGISLTPVFGAGWHGVNLGSVLSAFVLFLPYAAGDRDIDAPGAWWRFYRHRALRLLPPYYLIVVAGMTGAGRMSFADGPLADETFSVLTFTFPFRPDIWTPAAVDASVWPVGTEVLFGAAFPLLCWLCLRYGAARVLAVSLPVGFVFRLFGYLVASKGAVNWMEAMLLGRIGEFAWGFLLAEAFVRGRIPKRPYLLWILGVAILVPVLDAYARVIGGGLPRVLLVPLADAIDVAFVLLAAAALAGRSWWGWLLTMRWLRVAGMACYSLYLWHYSLLYSLHLQRDPWNGPNLAAYVLFLCILSAMTYRFIEFRQADDWRPLFLIGQPRRPVAARVPSSGTGA
jgi:peptidoglycan/LPS O-acetylase OafA/YrhL